MQGRSVASEDGKGTKGLAGRGRGSVVRTLHLGSSRQPRGSSGQLSGGGWGWRSLCDLNCCSGYGGQGAWGLARWAQMGWEVIGPQLEQRRAGGEPGGHRGGVACGRAPQGQNHTDSPPPPQSPTMSSALTIVLDHSWWLPEL